MPSRSRSRSGAKAPGGQIFLASGSTINFPDNVGSMSESCTDFVGNFTGMNGFDLDKRWKRSSPMTGRQIDSNGKLISWSVGEPIPTGFGSGYGPLGYSTTFTESSDAALAVKVLARSNPSRPVVDLPVFIYELRDIPHMIKEAGEAIRWAKGLGKGTRPTVRGLAQANLSYQFGWRPLISDLWKLFTFQSAYEKKRAELEKLFSKGGLHRSVSLESEERNKSFENLSINSTGVGINARAHSSAIYHAWGSVRWKPTLVPPGTRHPSDLEIYRAALGLDITLSTVWEAIPWSWLIDWFSTVGDFLSAYRNTIPATYSDLCIMRKRELYITYTTQSITNGYEWGGAEVGWWHKSRKPYVGLIYPTVSLPFLSGSQLSILSSLHITRASK